MFKDFDKKKIPGPLGPKVSAGRHALLYSWDVNFFKI
jgi:hypothetical protein